MISEFPVKAIRRAGVAKIFRMLSLSAKREPSPTRVEILSTRRLTAQFRQDLKISAAGSNESGGKAYVVEDPVTHESFSFGEEEYFLCKVMDGTSTSEEVLQRFQRRFGVEMSEAHFRNFEEHLLAMGLAEIPEGSPELATRTKEPSASRHSIFGVPQAKRPGSPLANLRSRAVFFRRLPPHSAWQSAFQNSGSRADSRSSDGAVCDFPS